MSLYRVLIADSTNTMAKMIAKHIGSEVQIHRCNDSGELISNILTVEPDILYLDLHLVAGMGYFLLQSLQRAGRKMKIIVASAIYNDVICAQMGQLEVDFLVPKPCNYGLVISLIRDLCFQIEHPEPEDWCLENETDHMLLDLGFRMGPNRYRCVFEAVLQRYFAPDSSMKELYIDVAKRCGGKRKLFTYFGIAIGNYRSVKINCYIHVSFFIV